MYKIASFKESRKKVIFRFKGIYNIYLVQSLSYLTQG